MDLKEYSTPLAVLFISLVVISSNSIGIQCLNEKNESSSNKNWLILNLVAALLLLIFSLYKMFMIYKS
jgi:hypothetical protein